MLSITKNPVELYHKGVLINFNHQEPPFYAGLFGESDNIPFKVPPGHTKAGLIINQPLVIINCVFFRKAIFVLSIVVLIFFFCEKVGVDHFKYAVYLR